LYEGKKVTSSTGRRSNAGIVRVPYWVIVETLVSFMIISADEPDGE
jgi:hypothetical protein